MHSNFGVSYPLKKYFQDKFSKVSNPWFCANIKFPSNFPITIVTFPHLPPTKFSLLYLRQIYYAGVNKKSGVGELIALINATDKDFGANASIEYLIAASFLYKYGATKSTGNIVPSPFGESIYESVSGDDIKMSLLIH